MQEIVKNKLPKYTNIITLVYNIWTRVAVVKTATEDLDSNTHYAFVMVWNHQGVPVLKKIIYEQTQLCDIADADVDLINNFGKITCKDGSRYIASIAV